MNNKQNINIRMSSAISLCLLAALMVAVVPQTLSSLHARMETALCANNLKGCVQAWNVYASEFDGKYMAWWDTSNNYGMATTQIPYTMWYYTKGISLPGAAYDGSQGGWYNPETLSYGGFSMFDSSITSSSNPQYHCPAAIKKTEIESLFRELASYSSNIFYVPSQVDDSIQWQASSSNFYPAPALFKHASTTLLIQDLAKPGSNGYVTLWAAPGMVPFGLHNGKDNHAFADGHVELLAEDAITEDMFKLYYLLDE